MANGNRFKADRGGVIEFLRSAPVADLVGDHAERVCSRANAAADPTGLDVPIGDLYDVRVDDGRFTAVGKVVAVGKVAKHDNAENNTLVRALG